jgi:carboxypeptidase Taq
MNQSQLESYQEWVQKMSAYQMALSLIDVDKQTLAPAGGTEYRDERESILAGELFSIKTDPSQVKIRRELLQQEDLDGDTRRAIELYDRDIGHILAIPKKEFIAHQKLCSESYGAWHKAKDADDYSIFEPYLKRLIESCRRMYSYRSSALPLYDQMLDDFEPGMNCQAYDQFFDLLKSRLVPLIRQVQQAAPIDDSFLSQSFPVEQQKEFMASLLQYLGFDRSWGYQNETEHPFTTWLCENDCRITTKYLERNVASAVLSTVHEAGHAYYEHDIDPRYDGMILSEGVSSGMHESQSRLCENYLGRTLPFWQANYPKLQEVFPQQLGGISCEQFVQAINISKPSLIRTEADELTYPMHILIRYELEKGLFNGTISTEGLDRTWNKMYQKYLGISSKNDRDGILQDVHWSDGAFGYFPTYALGSAFAAQFMEAMRKDIDVDELLRTGHYPEVIGWLKEHVQHYGCRYDAKTIVKMATGREFDPESYVSYLEMKYRKLYHLGY